MNSKLQIISGEYRGRKLALPDGARPTQNMARGAIFNMLGEILLEPYSKLSAWDAFAGSGALGIEMLSRYPNSRAIFTDISDESIRTIRKNTVAVAANRVRIINTDAAKVIKSYAFDVNLIFVDPPYEKVDIGVIFIKKLAESVRPGTIVVQEIEKIIPYAPDAAKWDVLRDKNYGRARFLILRRKSDK